MTTVHPDGVVEDEVEDLVPVVGQQAPENDHVEGDQQQERKEDDGGCSKQQVECAKEGNGELEIPSFALKKGAGSPLGIMPVTTDAPKLEKSPSSGRSHGSGVRSARKGSPQMMKSILNRDNTIAVKEAKKLLNNVAKRMTREEMSLIMSSDAKVNLYTSMTGVVHLFLQKRTLFFLVYHTVVCFLHGMGYFSANIPSTTILGWVCGLLVAFRQNQGMSRWWEGRCAWGKLIRNSRDLAREVLLYSDLDSDYETPVMFVMYLIAFAIVSKNHLRGIDKDEVELKPLLDSKDLLFVLNTPFATRPMAVLDLMSHSLNRLQRENALPMNIVIHMLEPKVVICDQCLGISQRIKNTPMPELYRVVLDFVIVIYLLQLPFMILKELNPVLGLLLCFLITLLLFGLSKLGQEMEDPHGQDPNDLPLGRFVATIAKQCLQEVDHSLSKRMQI